MGCARHRLCWLRSAEDDVGHRPVARARGSDGWTALRPPCVAPHAVRARRDLTKLSALLFLYRDVLGQDLPWLDDVVRAKRTTRLPVVLTREEVQAVVRQLRGTHRLMAILLYGAGLRLLECARLRVKDVDFARHQITVRAGKGDNKTAGYIGGMGRPGLKASLHPPIDTGLWDGLRERFRDRTAILDEVQCVRRIKEIGDYSTYRRIIKGCRLAAAELGCLLIELEQLWLGAATPEV
ncbi:MAG: site-specific integrase [Candidatus Rokubacteria bacterium]|nr:site-specific integrase [Candidatus Rokubacteria bacterium]